ncbi:MAG TPA: hypothetical protein VK579_12795 [Terriglobales bacterium]|nr:hypothetical protein [Terriglobales bacterium]
MIIHKRDNYAARLASTVIEEQDPSPAGSVNHPGQKGIGRAFRSYPAMI